MRDSKTHIIEASYPLFLQKGFKAVTMQDILQVTGLSKGAIYYHFKSKEEVFEACARRFFAGGIHRNFDDSLKGTFRDFMEAELTYILNSREFLIAWSKENNQPLSSNYFSLIFEAARILPEFKKDLADFREREMKAWTSAITKAKKSGEIQSEMTHQQIARLFIYVNKGLGMQLIMDNNFAEIHKELRVLWHNIYKSLL